jgi:hypothetical protein
VRLLLEAVHDDVDEALWNLAARREQLGRWVVQHRSKGVSRRRAGERLLGREHLGQRAPEREHVGGRAHLLAAHLLRRHVPDRAEHAAGLGGRERRGRDRSGESAAGSRQAEVEDLGSPVAAEEDVLGLEVAVHDALGVRRRQAVGDARADLGGLAPRQRAARECRAEALPVEQFHDGDRAVCHRYQLVNRHDVRVREGGDGTGFVLEARAHLGIVGEVIRQHLQGNVAAEPGIVCPVDLTHASGADAGDDLVLRDAGPWGERHVKRYPFGGASVRYSSASLTAHGPLRGTRETR